MFERIDNETVLIDGKYYRIMTDEESVSFIFGGDEQVETCPAHGEPVSKLTLFACGCIKEPKTP